MNDINEMPPKCQYCPYWELCKFPWVCPDMWQQDEEPIQSDCNKLENDTISRQMAIDALNKLDVSDGVGISSVACDLQEEAIRSIENLPSAQSEIIRCKDCKHGVDYYHEGNCYCSNPKWGLQYFGGSWEFYCADAERRTDG